MHRLVSTLLVVPLLLLGGCYAFNNPVDPAAANYQGFDSNPDDDPPAAPSALTRISPALGADTAALLRWTDQSDDEIGFRVELKIGIGGTYVEAVASPAAGEPGSGGTVELSLTGLTGESEYFYRVCAFNAAGDSDYSGEYVGPTAPNRPHDMAFSEDADSVLIEWKDASAVETGFVVQRADYPSGSYVTIANPGPDDGSHEDITVVNGQSYMYRVYATGANGNSGALDTGQVTIPF